MSETTPEPGDLGDAAKGGASASAGWGHGVLLDGLLRALDRESTSTLGRQGEDLARLALWRSPSTRDGLVSVQPWADWVREWNIEHPEHREHVSDRGIDLVATYADGHRTAVQVKLRDGGGLPVSVR